MRVDVRIGVDRNGRPSRSSTWMPHAARVAPKGIRKAPFGVLGASDLARSEDSNLRLQANHAGRQVQRRPVRACRQRARARRDRQSIP